MSTTVPTAETPELARENAVFRKVIRRIIPFLILCYPNSCPKLHSSGWIRRASCPWWTVGAQHHC